LNVQASCAWGGKPLTRLPDGNKRADAPEESRQFLFQRQGLRAAEGSKQIKYVSQIFEGDGSQTVVDPILPVLTERSEEEDWRPRVAPQFGLRRARANSLPDVPQSHAHKPDPQKNQDRQDNNGGWSPGFILQNHDAD
jgi:hypothetical protein